MSIYEKMVQSGVRIENHCSDLYVPKNETTDEIVQLFAYRTITETFMDNIDGTLWYNIPFCYDPYWIEKSKQ